MTANQHQWLREPSERVGTLAYGLPPPANRDPDDERQLLRALRNRDATAFATILDHYYSPMLRLAQSYVRSAEEAEEVVQDTWLAVLAGLPRFEGRSSLKTWIFRILVNRARSRATREARMLPFSTLAGSSPREPSGRGEPDSVPSRLPGLTGDQYWYGQVPAPPNPEDELLSEELLATITRVVEALPPRQREVITLRDIEGWTAEEVRELLEISEGNQRVLLHRARLRVRDAVAGYLTGSDTHEVSAADQGAV